MNHPANDAPVDFDPFASGPLGDWAPTTDPQRELLASALESAEGSAAFNQVLSIRLAGNLDSAAMRLALNGVVSRHDALRACFAPDGLSFVVAQFDAIDLAEEDLSGAAADGGDVLDRYNRVVRREASEPLDLLNGPPIRARLCRIAPDLHYLLLTMHHVVCDGWSLGIVLEDLADLYSAAAAGNVAALPTAPSFAQYALDREADRASAANEAALRFMLERFGTRPPVVDLPYDRPRPPRRTYSAAQLTGYVDDPTLSALRQLCARNGTTLLAALCASLQSFIALLTGVDDLTIVIPAAGQVLHNRHGLVGHCVNAMPVRATVRLDDTFADVLKAVSRELVVTQDHQTCTFGTLLSRLDLPRDPSRVPLVPVMLTLERASRPLAFSGLDATLEPTPRNHEAFEWFVHIEDGAERLRITWTYNTDLFSRDRMERLLRHYVTFLDGLVEGQRPVRDVPLLSPADVHTLLVDRAGDRDTSAADGMVLEAVRRHVERDGDRCAVQDETGCAWSYAALWTSSARVAAGLEAHGVKNGDLVGVRMTRSASLPAVLLGVLRSGAAYLPLDPEFPAERLLYMIENGGASVVISDDAAPLGSAELIDPNTLLCATNDVSSSAWALPSPNDLAYVLYTSGSTGRPKGVEITHGALRNFLASMRRQPGLAQDDVLLAVTTLSFDISGLELFLPLCVGARVVIASKDTASDGYALASLIEASGTTVMQATPATWRMLIDSGWNGRLRKALCGGEALPDELARTLVTRADEAWNLYGPTETTIWSTCDRIAGDGPVLVGRPIAHTRTYVLDRFGRLVPDGVRGEIWIAGAGVARGYRNQPELTEKRFCDDPFVPGARMYRTGDVGRWHSDGRLEHLGRLDFQVKVHGFRIELGEIESALEALDEVRHAVVAACGVAEDRRLVAYVIFEERRALMASEIRRRLSERLPQYMVPGIIVSMDSFPFTPNGKVDRKALPDPLASDLATAQREYEPPVGPLEESIAAVWRDLLRVERVSRHDNFFELGGHSLLAVQAAALVARRINYVVEPRELVFRTLMQLASANDQLVPAGTSTAADDETASDPAAGGRRLKRLIGSIKPLRR